MPKDLTGVWPRIEDTASLPLPTHRLEGTFGDAGLKGVEGTR